VRRAATKALDLYCGAGGATRGLQQASFHVVGIDLYPQPNYIGDRFIQADVLSLSPDFLRTFDFIWSSPPCQALSTMRHVHNAKPHLNLIPATRALLKAAGKPFVIENVEGARAHLHSPTRLCGSMFGLRAPSGELRRHRLFETSFLLTASQRSASTAPITAIGADHPERTTRAAAIGRGSTASSPWVCRSAR
jgi:DNA (cytosine-5)-methyltransferase 1